MGLNQKENPEEFFNKYGFRSTIDMAHPKFKDMMHFEGLEADYVSHLEFQVSQLQKYIDHQSQKMDWLRDREFAKYLHDSKKESK